MCFELVWCYQYGLWMVQYPDDSFRASGYLSPPGLSFCTLKGGLLSLWGPGWLHSVPQTSVDMVLTALVVRPGSTGQAANEETALQPQEWDFNKCDVESIHMPWSVVWIFWVACESTRSSGLMLEDGDRWRQLNTVWPHPCCSLVEANLRMNPSFMLKRCKGNSPNHYERECRADIKGWMLKLASSPSLISQDMDRQCQSSLELLPCLGRKHNSIDLINYSIISIRLETQS